MESGGQPRGPLRVAVPLVVGHMLMGGIAARFRARFPQVTLEVHVLDRLPDLISEGFDGALTGGPLEDSSQIARLMMHSHDILVAAPGLPGLDRLHHLSDLLTMPLVGLATPWRGGWALKGPDGPLHLACDPALKLGSHQAVCGAVKAGAGISVLPRLLAVPSIQAGRLLQVLPDWTAHRQPLYFVYPSAHSVTARLRAFIDHLSAERG